MADRWLCETGATKSTTTGTSLCFLLHHVPPPTPWGCVTAVPALLALPCSWLIHGEEEELPHHDAHALLLQGDQTLVALQVAFRLV